MAPAPPVTTATRVIRAAPARAAASAPALRASRRRFRARALRRRPSRRSGRRRARSGVPRPGSPRPPRRARGPAGHPVAAPGPARRDAGRRWCRRCPARSRSRTARLVSSGTRVSGTGRKARPGPPGPQALYSARVASEDGGLDAHLLRQFRGAVRATDPAPVYLRRVVGAPRVVVGRPEQAVQRASPPGRLVEHRPAGQARAVGVAGQVGQQSPEPVMHLVSRLVGEPAAVGVGEQVRRRRRSRWRTVSWYSGDRNANQPKQPYMCQSAAPACCAIRSPAPVFPGCPTGQEGPTGR